MNKSLKIIGLGGTNGAGKDTVGELLAEHYNYWFFSFTDLFREECRKRNIPAVRENLRKISSEWCDQDGLGAVVDRSMVAFEHAGGFNKYRGIVMSSMRRPGEADRIHELGGTVIWVDADPRTRYDRIQANAANRSRAGEDSISFEDFLQHEADEMHPPQGAPATALHGAAVKERSDIFVVNNTSNLEDLSNEVVQKLHL